MHYADLVFLKKKKDVHLRDYIFYEKNPRRVLTRDCYSRYIFFRCWIYTDKL